jgi:hypothetical protein
MKVAPLFSTLGTNNTFASRKEKHFCQETLTKTVIMFLLLLGFQLWKQILKAVRSYLVVENLDGNAIFFSRENWGAGD